MTSTFPTSQGELIRAARGHRSQAEFAELLGVDRSCLSRYESEKLGAPVTVLNYCLEQVAQGFSGGNKRSPVDQALIHVQRAAKALSEATKVAVLNSPSKRNRNHPKGRTPTRSL